MIKVKKLPWDENKFYIPAPMIKQIQVWSPKLSTKDKFEVVRWKKGGLECKTIALFDTLEEAQNYVQPFWDEYVLSLVEE